jgi:hypothetical protein
MDDRPSSMVYGLWSAPQTRLRPAWVALLITQWGDKSRAGKLRLNFWKRCLSHRQTVESPVVGLFSLAYPKCYRVARVQPSIHLFLVTSVYAHGARLSTLRLTDMGIHFWAFGGARKTEAKFKITEQK